MQSKFGTMLKKGPFTNKRHEAAGGIVAPDVLTTSTTQISEQSVSFSEASHSAFMHQEKFKKRLNYTRFNALFITCAAEAQTETSVV